MSHSMAIGANPLTSSLPTQGLGSATTKLKAAAAPTSGSAAGSSASTGSTDSIGSTFLSLLVQELQNQDPTAPMDSTAMVGQMISLNQLDQLTSINQTLTGAYGTVSSGTASSGTASGASSQAVTNSATAAALRLLASRGVTAQPAVSTSVTLPAF